MSILADNEQLDLSRVLKLKYAVAVENKRFDINVYERNDNIYTKITLFNDDESYYYPVLAKATIEQVNNKRKLAMILLDFLDAYFNQYLVEDDHVFLPIDWKKYDYEGVDLYAKGQILNRKAEKAVDALLLY